MSANFKIQCEQSNGNLHIRRAVHHAAQPV